jgi:hypothetical protein
VELALQFGGDASPSAGGLAAVHSNAIANGWPASAITAGNFWRRFATQMPDGEPYEIFFCQKKISEIFILR